MGRVVNVLVLLVALLLATPAGSAAADPEYGRVTYIDSACDLFVVVESRGSFQSLDSYALLEYRSGYRPDTGDHLYGRYQEPGEVSLLYLVFLPDGTPQFANERNTPGVTGVKHVEVSVKGYGLSGIEMGAQYVAGCQ